MTRAEYFNIRSNQGMRLEEGQPILIGCGQTSTPEWLIDKIIKAADIKKGHSVLEVGTGCGYQTYKLSQLVKRVHTVERFQKLLETSRSKLNEWGIRNIRYRFGDGSKGWPWKRFDRIIVCATAEKVPVGLLNSLKRGGIMLIPIGDVLKVQSMMKITRTKTGITSESLWPIRSVPLVEGNDGVVARSK